LISKGVPTTIRVSRGEDILAACGQLKSNFDSSLLPGFRRVDKQPKDQAISSF
jgi:hypothetical protein